MQQQKGRNGDKNTTNKHVRFVEELDHFLVQINNMDARSIFVDNSRDRKLLYNQLYFSEKFI